MKKKNSKNKISERRYESLRQWRNGLARERALRPYLILSNRTLHAIADAFPRDEDALLEVRGIGPVKLEQYGAAILKTLRPR